MADPRATGAAGGRKSSSNLPEGALVARLSKVVPNEKIAELRALGLNVPDSMTAMELGREWGRGVGVEVGVLLAGWAWRQRSCPTAANACAHPSPSLLCPALHPASTAEMRSTPPRMY